MKPEPVIHCNTSPKRRPIRAYDGRIIGFSDGVVFKKTVEGSKHLLKCPPAIAIDAVAYENDIAPTHERIEVKDVETDRLYSISIEAFERNKEEMDRGHGRQYFVRLRYWRCESRNGAKQLALWGCEP